jgi:hypothetical protein
MSAPESQPADHSPGSESADLPPTQGECLDDDYYSLECIKEFCSNGDVLYSYAWPCKHADVETRSSDEASTLD